MTLPWNQNEKTARWIEEEIIPGFLKEDMKKYMLDNNKKIDNNNSFLIEDQQQSFLVELPETLKNFISSK